MDIRMNQDTWKTPFDSSVDWAQGLVEQVSRARKQMEDEATLAMVLDYLRGKGYTVVPPGGTDEKQAALRRVEALAKEWKRDAVSPRLGDVTREVSNHHADRIRAALAASLTQRRQQPIPWTCRFGGTCLHQTCGGA